MNVVFVNSMRSFGGGEQWLLEAAGGLRDRGHRVAVAARARGALAARVATAGFRVLELPMSGDLDLGSAVRLARFMRREGAELACPSVQRAVRLTALSATIAPLCAVVERKGLVLPVRRTLVNRLVYARSVHHVIANCEAIRASIVQAGLVPSERVSVIPNGIDPRRIGSGGGAAVRAELGIGPADPVVAVVGRLVPDKAHRDALRAFARLVRELPSARLLVAGDGKLRGELERDASETTPQGSVMFLGERKDVPAVLDAADALLVTSVREGMPHVVLEAMAAGTPVVATAVAGIPEMIRDGRDGLLVPPGEPEKAFRATATILSDPALARRLAQAAERRVREEFSLSAMLDRVERCFERELGRARLKRRSCI